MKIIYDYYRNAVHVIWPSAKYNSQCYTTLIDLFINAKVLPNVLQIYVNTKWPLPSFYAQAVSKMLIN